MKIVLLDPVVVDEIIDEKTGYLFFFISFIALVVLLLIFHLVKRKKK